PCLGDALAHLGRQCLLARRLDALARHALEGQLVRGFHLRSLVVAHLAARSLTPRRRSPRLLPACRRAFAATAPQRSDWMAAMNIGCLVALGLTIIPSVPAPQPLPRPPLAPWRTPSTRRSRWRRCPAVTPTGRPWTASSRNRWRRSSTARCTGR